MGYFGPPTAARLSRPWPCCEGKRYPYARDCFTYRFARRCSILQFTCFSRTEKIQIAQEYKCMIRVIDYDA